MGWLMLEKLLPRSVPAMSRPSYRRELGAVWGFSVAAAMLEAGVVGVLAKLVFDVSDIGFAKLAA